MQTQTHYQDTQFGSSFKDSWQTQTIVVDQVERLTSKAALFHFGWVPASIIKEVHITEGSTFIREVVLPTWFCIKNNI